MLHRIIQTRRIVVMAGGLKPRSRPARIGLRSVSKACTVKRTKVAERPLCARAFFLFGEQYSSKWLVASGQWLPLSFQRARVTGHR